MNPEGARRLVEARLGRPAQDALEAAVVLEAWAGVPAQRALETARMLMPGSAGPAPASSAAPRAVPRPPGVAVEAGAFFVTVFAIALWVEPLARALGGDAVSRALVAALPLTLALQWALLARHLGRPAGLAGVGAGSLAVGAVAVVAGLTLVLGVAGTLAGLLTVTWTAGGIAIRRGWAVAYCVVVAGATPALAAGADPLVVVAVVAAAVAALALLAVGTAAGTPATPGRWSRTLGAGLTGAGVGVLIVGDPSVTWTAGASAALALAPSTAGALWAGQHLWRLAGAFPRALVGVPACAALPAPAPRGGPRRLGDRAAAAATGHGAPTRLVPANDGYGPTGHGGPPWPVPPGDSADANRHGAPPLFFTPGDGADANGQGAPPQFFPPVDGAVPDGHGAPPWPRLPGDGSRPTAHGAPPRPGLPSDGSRPTAHDTPPRLVLPGEGSRPTGRFTRARLVSPRLEPPAATLLGALARLAALTLAGSAVLLLAGGGRGGVLAGFGAIALATLLVGLLESLGRPSAAALGIAAGVVAELLVRVAGPPFPGAALLAGGVVAVGVLVPAAFVLLSRPARTLATSLWIT